MSGKIKVTQKRSTAGQLRHIQASVRGLGLRRIGHSVVVLDTAPNRGMINTASHLVAVEKA
ncbi:MAG TPA: 50S ribosomal protein L30 [Steroidobacteraceae bacterium]|jgi:large subunit ribosomal protein L30|nr:50S ribosomal protein L30 [Steroidobacteraceae bacterium]